MEKYGFELGKVFQLADKRFKCLENESLAQFGLTHFHAKYIANLYCAKELTMTELTEQLGVDKANTTRVVRDLEQKGYVERANNNIRKFALRLSQRGREVAEYYKKRIISLLNKIFENFSNEEKDTLFTLLNKLMLGVKKC